MAWNKCSEKLPKVGMLVITREWMVAGNYWIYLAGIIKRGEWGLHTTNPDCGYLTDAVEWKEVEKD